jgi:PAS domain S-box-containing protein
MADRRAQQKLVEVEAAARERIALLWTAIEVRKAKGLQTVRGLVQSGRGRASMDRVRSRVDEAVAIEIDLLKQRSMQQDLKTRRVKQELLAVSLLAITVLGAVFTVLMREIARRGRVEKQLYVALEERTRANEELRQSEQRFASFMLNLPAAAWMKDPGGRYVYANAKVFGGYLVTLSAVVGKSDDELVPPEMARQLRENDERVLAQGESVQTIEVLRLPDETEHHYLVNKFPIPGPDGQAAYAAGIALDITERVKAEEVLRFSEARFRALHDDNPAMILTIDPEGTIVSTNIACTSHLGYPAAELEGQPILKIFHEDDRPVVAEQLRSCVQHPDQVYRWQFRKIHKDGRLLWVEELARAVYDLNGALKVLVVCQDITERKRAEEALEQSERKFSTAFNAVPALLSIATLKEGRLIDINEAALQMLGYRRDEVIGRTVQEINFWEEYSDRTKALQVLEEQGSVRNLEMRYRGKEGQIFTGLFSAEYIELNGDRYVLSLVKDITDRKRAQEAVVRAKEEWERTFDSVPDHIAILDNRHKIARVNRAMAEWLGRQPEECVGLTCYTTIDGTASPPSSCPHFKTLADGKGHGGEMHESRLDRDFLVTTTPLLDSEGRMVGVVHVARDITERKRTEMEIARLNADLAARAAELEAANHELGEANRELEAFNYTVAHDLRQPLNTVSSYCQVIGELCGVRLDEQCRDFLRQTYEGTLRMNQLIEALLNFSRMARVELRREQVDLSATAKAVAQELKLTEPGRRVTFLIAEGIAVEGDGGLLRIVLTNLIGNAWKYTGMREEATIEFGTVEIDGDPACFVRDNGPGFDMADADKLFTPFQRLPGVEGYRGFGIGLATVERVIRRHDGRIWAEGEPGKGATFYFTLPAGTAPA